MQFQFRVGLGLEGDERRKVAESLVRGLAKSLGSACSDRQIRITGEYVVELHTSALSIVDGQSSDHQVWRCEVTAEIQSSTFGSQKPVVLICTRPVEKDADPWIMVVTGNNRVLDYNQVLDLVCAPAMATA